MRRVMCLSVERARLRAVARRHSKSYRLEPWAGAEARWKEFVEANQMLEICSVACRDAINMVLHCQIKNKVFIWYEARVTWIFVHITNVTLCNTELINETMFVSACC